MPKPGSEDDYECWAIKKPVMYKVGSRGRVLGFEVWSFTCRGQGLGFEVWVSFLCQARNKLEAQQAGGQGLRLCR